MEDIHIPARLFITGISTGSGYLLVQQSLKRGERVIATAREVSSTETNLQLTLGDEYEHKKRISQSRRQNIGHDRRRGSSACNFISAGQFSRW
jgi:hypothetical protein